MIHADTDPASVRGQVVDAIRHRSAEFLDQKVMHAHLFRLALRTPLPSGVLEVADKLLLLRVDRDHRLLRGQRRRHALIDVGELRVAVRMVVALAGLAVGLQAELLLLQQFAHNRMADPVAAFRQFGCEAAQALARPAEWGHRIAPLARRHQRQQIPHQ